MVTVRTTVSEPSIEDARQTEDDHVIAWRLEQLLSAGYPVEDAEAIAGRTDIDLHRALQLAKTGGCTPVQAARILL